jgi:protocatechuate 4,5-dioxygenase beta chain
MNDTVRRIHRTYHVPASSTAAGLALFGNRPAASGVGR